MSTQTAATGFGDSCILRQRLAGLALLTGLIVGLVHPVAAEDWPGWRGPRGDGTSLETDVPVHWHAGRDGTPGEGLRWKVPLAGTGHASPIVWGDRVFVVACDPDTQQRLLLCHSADDGRLLWKQEVLTAPLEIKHQLNSFVVEGIEVFTLSSLTSSAFSIGA